MKCFRKDIALRAVKGIQDRFMVLSVALAIGDGFIFSSHVMRKTLSTSALLKKNT